MTASAGDSQIPVLKYLSIESLTITSINWNLIRLLSGESQFGGPLFPPLIPMI